VIEEYSSISEKQDLCANRTRIHRLSVIGIALLAVLPLLLCPEADALQPDPDGQGERFWTVQTVSFRRAEQAKRALLLYALPGGRMERIGPWFTVHYGFFHTEGEAQKFAKQLHEKGLLQVLVRTCYKVPERIVYPEPHGVEIQLDRSVSQGKTGDAATRDRAIALARAGEPEKALDLLDELVQRYPDDKKLLEDYMVILGWAGRDSEAFSLGKIMDVAHLRSYAVESLAKSARNKGLYKESIALYTRLVAEDPARTQAQTGLVMALSDAGRHDEAFSVLQPLLQADKRNVDLLFAKAYVHEKKREKLEALWLYEEILRYAPKRRDAERLRILAISGLGAPGVALAEAGKRPSLFSEEDWNRMRGDSAAAKVRWGEIPAADSRDRFVETDEAIKVLEADIGRLTDDEGMSDISTEVLRRRFDRVVALRDRYRMEEVTAEYERLVNQGVAVPDYVQLAAGDAYLYLEKPEAAAAAYTGVLALSPESFNARLSLFWAYIELGNFDKAIAISEELADGEAEWRIRRTEGMRSVYGKNDRKLLADAASAMGRAFAADLGGAQQRLEAITHAAPFNHDLRQRLAYVYLWRGWPREALGQFKSILSVDPELLDARVGEAAALMALRQYAKTEDSVNDLSGQFPEAKQVQKLQRRWDIHNRRIFRTEMGYGSASEADQDTDSFRIDTHLYSRPVKSRWRVFLHSFYEKGDLEIEDDDVSNQREGVGVEYSGPHIAGFMEIDHNKGSDADVDLAAGIEWDLDDHWQIGTDFDTFSLEVPLRARLRDITGWSVGFDVAYRSHESEMASLNLKRTDFDDNNTRFSGLVTLQRRMINGPYFKVPVTLELYGSTNTGDDRPYFNPEEDLSGTVTVDLRWLLWRRYARSFAHNLAFTGGLYWQEEFDTKGVGSIRYEHAWNFSDTLSLLYGFTWSRRVYDGDPENSTWSYMALDWRF
jgi:biofilm PGA synthesis protein PgaA